MLEVNTITFEYSEKYPTEEICGYKIRQNDAFALFINNRTSLIGVGTLSEFEDFTYGIFKNTAELFPIIYDMDFYSKIVWTDFECPLTTPIISEPDTVEIKVGSPDDDFDLSLLDDESRQFFVEFVDAIDPGQNFNADDLSTNDIY